jgi:sugar phosphate isomerase/epimerase
VRSYADAAKANDIVIAEVGAWSNPLSRDEAAATKAVEGCQMRLDLAERIGARCCVNISGSFGRMWYGPAAENLTPRAFDRIVETVRQIIDAVKPKRTFYCLETMPWAYPDSADSYLALIRAIDRKALAVHFDPVNLINNPEKYYTSGAVIREFVSKLGPSIRSCHAKDIILDDEAEAVRMRECQPGTGNLDYRTFLTEVNRLEPDVPVMMEHLKTEAEYNDAARHIRGVATELGIRV